MYDPGSYGVGHSAVSKAHVRNLPVPEPGALKSQDISAAQSYLTALLERASGFLSPTLVGVRRAEQALLRRIAEVGRAWGRIPLIPTLPSLYEFKARLVHIEFQAGQRLL